MCLGYVGISSIYARVGFLTSASDGTSTVGQILPARLIHVIIVDSGSDVITT